MSPVYATQTKRLDAPRESRWKALAGFLTAIAGIISAIAGITTVLHPTRPPEPAKTGEVQQLQQSVRDLKEQLTAQRARLETLPAKSSAPPNAAEEDDLGKIATQIDQWNRAAESPNPDVDRYLRDASLSGDERVAHALASSMNGIEQRVDSLHTSPFANDQTAQLKNAVDKRSQEIDTLRQIIDKYNDSARNIISSIGR